MRSVKDAVVARLFVCAALLAALVSGPALAGFSTAPDVVVYCEPTLRHAMEHVGALFRAQTRVPVRVFAAAGPLNLAQLAHGVRDDVLVARSAEMDAAARQHLIDPATRIDGWLNRLVLAVRSGQAHEATVSELLHSGIVAVTDPTVISGLDGFSVIALLGHDHANGDRALGAADSADVAFLVTRGSARTGLVYLTDVRADPALVVAAQVPPDAAPPVAYAAALTRQALSRNSQAFLDFLRSPEAAARLRGDGLETPP
jgi:molybdate transport system substrate-binding protein